MIKIPKILILIAILISVSYSQMKILDLIQDGELLVNGLIIQGETKFLVTDKGYLPVNSDDPWGDYYRMIYNDSTIVNPNTILDLNSNFIFFPAVDIDYQKFIKLPEQTKLKDFFGESLKGQIYFIPEKLNAFLKKSQNKSDEK